MDEHPLLWQVARRYALVAGRGTAPRQLNAFDAALRDAGVADMNLLKVSSILPPECEAVSTPLVLPPGALLPVAYADMATRDPHVVASAAVAVGIPEDASRPGVIMEHHGMMLVGECQAIVRELAEAAMEMRSAAIKTIRVTGIEARTEQLGVWSCAFAGVVLLP